jgi:hypothetical protein
VAQINTIPPAEVTAKTAPARIQSRPALDPASTSFTTECLFDEAHQRIGEPPQYELHYAPSHYHSLGAAADRRVVRATARPSCSTTATARTSEGDRAAVVGGTARGGSRTTNPRENWSLGHGDQETCVSRCRRAVTAWDGDVSDGSARPSVTRREVQHAGLCSLTAFLRTSRSPADLPTRRNRARLIPRIAALADASLRALDCET